ncbi:MAG: HD domain-containing protein [Candidatus Methanomethylicia archaeon]
MNNLLSYYYEDHKGNITKEYLIDHVKYGLEIIGKKRSSRIYKYMSNLSPGFLSLIKLAFIFHDTGKVFYQSNYKVNDKGERYLSFIGHEWFSSYIFMEYREELIEEDMYGNYRELDCVFLSILYHHHALNIRRRKPCVKELEINIWELEELINELIQLDAFIDDGGVFNRAIGNVRRKLREVKNLLENAILQVDEENRKTWRNFISSSKARKLFLSVLSVIIATDYVASQKRGQGRSRFYKSVEDFVNLYMS